MSKVKQFLKRPFTLRTRLQAFIVAPLAFVSIVVCVLTYLSLERNAENLTSVLEDQAQANRIYQLLLIQDDASKAILVDPELLTTFSEKKIEAYDQHKTLLRDIAASATNDRIRDIIERMQLLDEKELRPVDTAVLETLFEDPLKARRLYFETYEPSRQKYELMVRELLSASDAVVASEYQSMKRKNSLSLLIVAFALMIGVGVVIGSIQILGKQVERSDENLRTLLSAIPEGLFFFDETGKIANERSSNLELVLPGSMQIADIQNFSVKFSNTSIANVNAALTLLWAEDDGFFSDVDSTLAMLPRQVRTSEDDDRIIRVEYRPLYSAGGKFSKIAVAVADVTHQVQAERESKRQSERVKKITMIAGHIQSYREFAKETDRLLDRGTSLFACENKSQSETAELKRILHTLKGSIGTFEFSEIAEHIHEIESLAEEHGLEDETVKAAWTAAAQQLIAERLDIETILDIGTNNREYVDASKIEAIKSYLHHRGGDSTLHDLVARLSRVSLAHATQKYATYLEKLSSRRGDKLVTLVCDEGSDEISHLEIQKLDGALVHLFRNSFDHGIEDINTRAANGKAQEGVISVSFKRIAESLTLVLSDDGAGINAEKLVQKAVKGGIWDQSKADVASEEERLNLIYMPSLSSKDEASELSGRGVGMDAVKNDVESLGGTIRVTSKRGVGTTFKIVLPSEPTIALNIARKAG